jgi:hypothetical protein
MSSLLGERQFALWCVQPKALVCFLTAWRRQ